MQFDKFNPQEGGKILSDYSDNSKMSCKNGCAVSRKIKRMMINIFICYVLDYIILQCFNDRSFKKMIVEDPTKKDNKFIKNGYSIGVLSYSLGVLISRSSLFICKFPYVEVFTGTEICNWVAWLIQAILVYCKIPFVLFPWLMIVGMMDGFSYVNNFELVYSHKDLAFKEKELGSSILSLAYDMGILMSGIISLTFNYTFLHVNTDT